MKKKIISVALLGSIYSLTILSPSCKIHKEIQEKSGAVLWSENCSRCHYAPAPDDYNDAQWEVIGMHMQVRTNLTSDEAKKIIEFLQESN